MPSAPRVNYSLLIMETAGMMNMATGEGSPSGRVPGRAPERFLVATEACGGGTSDLGFFLEVSIFIRIFGVGNKSRRCPRGPQALRVRPLACGLLETLLVHLRCFGGLFWSIKITVNFHLV